MKNEIHYKFMKQNKLSTKPIKAITTFNKVQLRTETFNTKKDHRTSSVVLKFGRWKNYNLMFLTFVCNDVDLQEWYLRNFG